MHFSKHLISLIFAAILLGFLEFLSLIGIDLPSPIAFPFYLGMSVIFGYKTLIHGFRSLFRLNFKSIDLLMVIAVMGAFYLREYPEGAIVIILFTLAESLEDFGIAKSQSSLDALVNQMPKTVLLKGATTPLEISNVKIDDVILIKPSQYIPLDGVVVDGNSYVDESSITGEPLAKDKRPGDSVFAGTWNKQGFLEIKVKKIASDSTLQKIRDITFNATQNKAETQKFIEYFSQFYTPIVILLALFWMLFTWLWLHRPFDQGFGEALTLLVIACPCALVISTPISIFAAIGNASSSGALIKGGRFLEAIGQIKALALDKTRTLTYGKPLVSKIIPFGQNVTIEHLLSCAAGIELLSEHPLAQSIVQAAQQKNLVPHPVKNFESVMGKGAKAECLVCDDQHHCIGKLEFILEEHHVPQSIIDMIDTYQREGKTVIVISTSKEVEGLIIVEDELRADSLSLIESLKKLNVHPVMLTGDHDSVAQSVGKSLGINDVKASLLPEDKAECIKELISKYQSVGMFGDGVNDAPALALANVGISMSSLSSDTALEVASIVLLNDRLNLIPFLIQLGRKAIQTIKFNTFLAITVKMIFIFLALAGLSNLAMAIFADVGMTLIVIFVSLRLLKWIPKNLQYSKVFEV